ncbi:uncharacterized protein EV420DRAFT_1276300 [Desarmillaria tabescens]|uniref:TEA domain-containing protein n=1 Tax=Armillaria tabescens TaxID=1929756 RepID=A0AA39JR43_ARMTA|nr:uncharacterized protein EV420DRAFT_1276300 [Desarmillaria tabescens]KAK0446982.1 hypothetical protein EV420DRAFT_1276300 [Desarmillaria tabescens]
MNDVKPSNTTGAQEVFQTIYNGRKSWKTLRGGEMVWPAELEAALIEGLEQYQPDDSRETRLLGRFPMRNRFISEYIFRKTGRRRTAKQVGSRLQQLRETCTGKRLMDLLSPCRRPVSSSLIRSQYGSQHGLSSLNCDSASSSGSASVPITPTDEVASFGFPSHEKHSGRHTYCIDILPDDAATHRHGSATTSTSAITDNARRISDEPRPIRAIDPTLAFLSRSPIAANSNFTVLADGVVVFSEMTTLTLRDTPPAEAAPGTDGALLYTTPLVPGYWKTISESSDPTKYTICQDIVETPHPSGTLYSAIYKFSYPAGYSASDPQLLSDPRFGGFPFDNMPTECFGTDDSTEMMEYSKCESHVYDFHSFDDAAWGFSTPPHSDRSSVEKAVPSPREVFDNHSTPGSSSPTSVCFPTDLSNYMSETYQMQL